MARISTFVAACALTLAALPAAAGPDPELTANIVRINGKRYQKLSTPRGAVLVPSLGLPLASSLGEALCPGELKGKDEVLEITKAAPASAEAQALSGELKAKIAACNGEAAEATAKAPGGTGRDSGCAPQAAPEVGSDGKVKQPTNSYNFGCNKHFGK